MCAGTSGLHVPRSFDAKDLDSQVAGEVPENFTEHYQSSCRKPFPERYARFTQFGLLSAHQALQDAGLNLKLEDRTRVGVSMGVGAGAFNYLLPVDRALQFKGLGLWPALDHNFVIKYMNNAATSQLSLAHGIEGPSTTVSAACASGAGAIAIGSDWIRNGRADVVLVGACDSTVNPFVMHA